jgi:hypothetical protein
MLQVRESAFDLTGAEKPVRKQFFALLFLAQ